MTGRERSDEIAKQITDRIIEGLKKGETPWGKPWNSNHRRAFNGVSGKPYRGMNPLIINYRAQDNGYSLNCWFTFFQVRQLGGTVKKGETATPVVFFKTINKTKKTDEGDDEKETFRLLRFYYVFNIDQTEGLEKIREKYTQNNITNVIPPSEVADKLIKETGANILWADVDKACYNPEKDRITLPPREVFKTQAGFYSVALHETTHWTGHCSRLNRDQSKPFGSKEYAFEELIAELGGSFLCEYAGIPYTGQHADYIGNWIQALENDHRVIFRAAAKAQRAMDFITKTDFGAEDRGEEVA